MRPRVIPVRRYPVAVFARLTGALVVACALLTALPAGAAAKLSRDAQKVYDDYRSDAAIQPCDHTVATYRRTLREITPDIEEESPAFRPAVEAALRERGRGRRDCLEQDCRRSPARVARFESAGSAGGTTPPATQPAPAARPKAGARHRRPARPPPRPRRPRRNPRPPRRATPAPTVVPPPPVASTAPAPAGRGRAGRPPPRGHPDGPPDRARPGRAVGAPARARAARAAAGLGREAPRRRRGTRGARRPTARAQRGPISLTGSASAAVPTVYNPQG